MKINKCLLFFELAIAFFFLACGKQHNADCIKRTGETTNESRVLGDFSKIRMFSKINYTLVPDTVNKINFEAGEHILPYLKTEIINDTLVVENTIKCKFARSYKKQINCEIHFKKSLTYVLFEATGSLNCVGVIKSPELKFDSKYANENAHLLLDVGTFDFRQFSGSSDFTATGKAGLFYLYAADGGTLHFENLETGYTYASSIMLSKCYVYATKALGAEVKTYGQIFYRGTPLTLTQKISDNGKIQQIQ